MNVIGDRDKTDNWPISEIAELRKTRFVELVEKIARLRDAQYQMDDADDIARLASRVVAKNLPSNTLRAAAIFVDYLYGFGPNRSSFSPPAWVTAKSPLSEAERGSLKCYGFKDTAALEEGNLVVLIADIAEHGLHAGMAGIVKEVPSDSESEGPYLVEFGEPEESITLNVEVVRAWLRRPRPGDLLENYRL